MGPHLHWALVGRAALDTLKGDQHRIKCGWGEEPMTATASFLGAVGSRLCIFFFCSDMKFVLRLTLLLAQAITRNVGVGPLESREKPALGKAAATYSQGTSTVQGTINGPAFRRILCPRDRREQDPLAVRTRITCSQQQKLLRLSWPC